MNMASDEHLKIAVVDDDAIFLDLTCAILSSDSRYKPLPATSGSELFSILTKERVDCILLDYNLRDETGLSVKKRLDSLFHEASPVIMLTGSGLESTAVEAFRMGVSDYIPKSDMNPTALLSTISKVVADERQKSIVRAEHKRLGDSLKLDPITGLAASRQVDERLAQISKLDPIDRGFYAVLNIEIQEYISIMDYFGPEVADAALRAFGEKLKEIMQSSDLCGRYKGGDFVFIKKFASYPAAADLDIICSRLSEFLAFTMTTAFGKLKLSANVARMTEKTASL